ncbi:MAG: DUF3124 domain-containing protein, partial [Deltaproteobacteria bacterium]|nr:DUF3124 domain-containing protein [Deltaproteobacteria bacterium]
MPATKSIRRISILALLLIPIVILVLLSIHHEGSGDRDLRYQPPQGEPDAKHENGISAHTVYVPVYSHVYFGKGKPYLLTTTLSIRNTDLTRGIIIKSVEYYNTNGKLVRSYLAGPLRLGPLASKEVLVEEHDFTG